MGKGPEKILSDVMNGDEYCVTKLRTTYVPPAIKLGNVRVRVPMVKLTNTMLYRCATSNLRCRHTECICCVLMTLIRTVQVSKLLTKSRKTNYGSTDYLSNLVWSDNSVANAVIVIGQVPGPARLNRTLR